MTGIAAAVADGGAIKAEIIEDEYEEPLNVITAEPEAADTTAENVEPTPDAESTEGIAQPKDMNQPRSPRARAKARKMNIHEARKQVSQNSKNPATAPDFSSRRMVGVL
jgi:hypothetical protein